MMDDSKYRYGRYSFIEINPWQGGVALTVDDESPNNDHDTHATTHLTPAEARAIAAELIAAADAAERRA